MERRFRLSTLSDGVGTTNHGDDGCDDGSDIVTGVLGVNGSNHITPGVISGGNGVPKRENSTLSTEIYVDYWRESNHDYGHLYGMQTLSINCTSKDAYHVTHVSLSRTYLRYLSSPETELGSEKDDLTPRCWMLQAYGRNWCPAWRVQDELDETGGQLYNQSADSVEGVFQ